MCYRTKKLNTAKGQIDHNFGNFTDTKRISQGLLEGDLLKPANGVLTKNSDFN